MSADKQSIGIAGPILQMILIDFPQQQLPGLFMLPRGPLLIAPAYQPARLLQPQEDLRYIFVLPHIRMAQELVLPSVPCLFATVDYNGQEVPDVRFYTESEGGRDGAV